MDFKYFAEQSGVSVRMETPADLDRRLFEDKDGGGNYGDPFTVFVAHAALRDVSGANDLVGDPVDLLLFVPRFIGIEIHVERRGKHLSGQLFRVFAGLFVSLAERVVLAQIAVGAPIGGDSQANARG